MKEQSVVLQADDPERVHAENGLLFDYKYQKTMYHTVDAFFGLQHRWVHYFIYTHGNVRETIEIAATPDWTPQSQNPNITFQFAILTDGAFTYVAHLPITSHQIRFDSELYIKDMDISLKGVNIELIY